MTPDGGFCDGAHHIRGADLGFAQRQRQFGELIPKTDGSVMDNAAF